MKEKKLKREKDRQSFLEGLMISNTGLQQVRGQLVFFFPLNFLLKTSLAKSSVDIFLSIFATEFYGYEGLLCYSIFVFVFVVAMFVATFCAGRERIGSLVLARTHEKFYNKMIVCTMVVTYNSPSLLVLGRYEAASS